MNAVPKGTPAEIIDQLTSAHGDTRPIVLTMTFGQHYDQESFSKILTYLATFRNFRGMAVLDRDKRLIGYSPASQIVWLSSNECTELRQQLLQYIEERKLEDISKHVVITNVTVSLGSTFADTLHLGLRENLTCIAVVDSAQRLCGIVERDRVMAALVLSLTRIARGSPPANLLSGDEREGTLGPL